MLRFMAFGCTHQPIAHPAFHAWKLRQIEEFDPHYLIELGDVFEGLAASRWAKHPEHNWKVTDEFNAVENYFHELNDAAPNAKKIFIFGNHDSNLLHEPHRVTDDTRALIELRWQRLLEGGLDGWKIPCKAYAHDAYFRLGQITFQHGGNTGKAQTHSHLHKQGIEYGVPYGLHVSAHTHAPVQVHQMQWLDQPLPYWVANVGTGADWEQMHYMSRASKALWGRAIVRGEVSPASAQNSKAGYTKPQWSAETIFHSFANGNRRI